VERHRSDAFRTIRPLPIQKPAARFHDFDQYERLVEAAKEISPVTELIVLRRCQLA